MRSVFSMDFPYVLSELGLVHRKSVNLWKFGGKFEILKRIANNHENPDHPSES